MGLLFVKINKSFILFALFLSSLQARVENVEFVAKEVHKVGDIVTVESPNGSYEVEIIEIK